MLGGAVIFARRMDRLVAFYSSLGFAVQEMQPSDYAVLTGSETELSIVQIPERFTHDIEIEDPPRARSRTPIKLCFLVPSIDEALLATAALGGRTAADAARWEFRGHRVQDAIDPEGNVYQLREPLA